MVSLEAVAVAVAVVAPSVAVALVPVLQLQPMISKDKGLCLSKKPFEEVFYSIPNSIANFWIL